MASLLYPGEAVFDDSTTVNPLVPPGFDSGYRGMFHAPNSADDIVEPFPSNLEIPETDWQGIIEEHEERKLRVSDLVSQAGLPSKFQDQTNLCWAFGPVHLLEVQRVVQNQPMISLSPASVAGPINGFQNKGGWGEDAMRQLCSVGAVPTSLWPDTAIDKRYYTASNKAVARDYRVTKWWRLEPRNRKQHISCLLLRIPVAVGLNYWRHEVDDYEAVWHNGQIGVRFRNSYGPNWPSNGAQGYSIRQGNKLFADDAVAIIQAVAS